MLKWWLTLIQRLVFKIWHSSADSYGRQQGVRQQTIGQAFPASQRQPYQNIYNAMLKLRSLIKPSKSSFNPLWMTPPLIGKPFYQLWQSVTTPVTTQRLPQCHLSKSTIWSKSQIAVISK
jgi:hypothetical protein